MANAAANLITSAQPERMTPMGIGSLARRADATRQPPHGSLGQPLGPRACYQDDVSSHVLTENWWKDRVTDRWKLNDALRESNKHKPRELGILDWREGRKLRVTNAGRS